MEGGHHAKPASGLLATLTKHSRISNLIYSKIAILKAKQGFISYYDNLYNADYSGWKRFTAAIASFQDICKKNDIDFVAVIFPLFSHDMNEMAYPFHKYHQLIHEQLEANAIPYLDLFPIFAGLDHDRLQVIPDIDPHPNEIAHRMAAEALMRYLINQGTGACGTLSHLSDSSGDPATMGNDFSAHESHSLRSATRRLTGIWTHYVKEDWGGEGGCR